MSAEKAARTITNQNPRTKTIEPVDARFFSPIIICSTLPLLPLLQRVMKTKTAMLRF